MEKEKLRDDLLENSKKLVFGAEKNLKLLKDERLKRIYIATNCKDEIKKELVENGFADIYFQPTGKVVCRCLTECVVKKVTDQWFLKYGNRKWKEDTWKALSKMTCYVKS